MSTTYTITASIDDNPFGGNVQSRTRSQKEAVREAEEFCRAYPGYRVYVEFARSSDGQTGYLNRDGNHDITGRDWSTAKRVGAPLAERRINYAELDWSKTNAVLARERGVSRQAIADARKRHAQRLQTQHKENTMRIISDTGDTATLELSGSRTSDTEYETIEGLIWHYGDKDKFVWDESAQAYRCSQDDFDFWVEATAKENKIDSLADKMADKYGRDAVQAAWSRAVGPDQLLEDRQNGLLAELSGIPEYEATQAAQK